MLSLSPLLKFGASLSALALDTLVLTCCTMKTAQVIELKKSLASAVTANRTDDMKRILLRLRQELTATEEIIRVSYSPLAWLLLEDLSAQVLGVVVFHAQDTKIGLSVGKLRTNANKEISELAKDIVKKVQSFRHCFAF